MKASLRLRLVAIVPALFSLAGAWIVWICLQYRAYLSPTRGVIVGVGLIAVAGTTVVLLWRAMRSSVVLVLVSGGYLFIATYMWPWVLGVADMVNAGYSDEAPSFILLHWFEIALTLIAILTIAAALGTRNAFRTET
jgi:hypothetical protein